MPGGYCTRERIRGRRLACNWTKKGGDVVAAERQRSTVLDGQSYGLENKIWASWKEMLHDNCCFETQFDSVFILWTGVAITIIAKRVRCSLILLELREARRNAIYCTSCYTGTLFTLKKNGNTSKGGICLPPHLILICQTKR